MPLMPPLASVLGQLLPIFVDTLLPVFLVALAGYVLAAFLPLEGRTLGRLLFYLATPSLVLRSLYQTQIDFAAMQRLALVVFCVMAVGGATGWLLSAGRSRSDRVAVTLTSFVGNNGNMGIPISFFALGEVGLALGTLYYVVSSFLSNTIGAMLASFGGSSGDTTWRQALRQTVRVPVLYAALAGLALNRLQVELPLPLFRAVDLLADAAIPGMLVLLGVQLRATTFATTLAGRRSLALVPAAARLLVTPLVAVGLCALLGIAGAERGVLILQSAMPTAVMATVLATEFDASPRLVATIIFATTVLSLLTLPVVLALIL